MRKLFVFIILIIACLQACKKSETLFPDSKRRAIYWTSPVILDINIDSLAKADLLIVDLENMFNNYQHLLAIKKLNPSIKLICYSNPMEIFTERYANRTWQNKVIDTIYQKRPDWLLKDYDDEPVVFWEGMVMLNLSDYSDYHKWMAEKLLSEILLDTIWDGYFMDNCTPNISWVGEMNIANYQPFSTAKIDRHWERGVRRFLSIIREGTDSSFIIIGNKGDLAFSDLLNGKMFENFPNDWLGDKRADGWFQSMKNAQAFAGFSIFSINPGEIEFGLSSAMLLDNVYFVIGQDYALHFNDKYLEIGRPVEGFRAQGSVFLRKYQKGLVKVFPYERKGQIILD